jgi:hypothetical protein
VDEASLFPPEITLRGGDTDADNTIESVLESDVDPMALVTVSLYLVWGASVKAGSVMDGVDVVMVDVSRFTPAEPSVRVCVVCVCICVCM